MLVTFVFEEVVGVQTHTNIYIHSRVKDLACIGTVAKRKKKRRSAGHMVMGYAGVCTFNSGQTHTHEPTTCAKTQVKNETFERSEKRYTKETMRIGHPNCPLGPIPCVACALVVGSS